VPVLGLEVALGRAAIENPGIEAGRVDLFGALPHASGTGHRALQQRGLDPLTLAGDFACAQRRADAEAGVEERAQARPLRGDEQRAGTRRALHPVLRDFEIGERVGLAVHVVQRAFGPAALFEHQAGTCLHQRVDRRTLRKLVVAAVAGDRADDDARVQLRQRGVVDAELGGFARCERLDDDVGGLRQRQEDLLVVGIVQIEKRAALAALPDVIAELMRAGLLARRIATGRFDLGDAGAVVAEQHRGHRPGDAGRKIEDFE